jgi:hypothetical protein
MEGSGYHRCRTRSAHHTMSPSFVYELDFRPCSRLWWALPPRYCRCTRSPMHDIALRLPTLLRHEQKRGRLGTSDGQRFARASLSSSEIKIVIKLRRSMQNI